MNILLRKKVVKNNKLFLFTILPYIIIFILWSIFTYANIVRPIILPKPHIVLITLINLFSSGVIFYDLLVTLLRVLFAFSITILLSIPLGLIIGLYKEGKALLNPLIVLRYIPYSAIIPLSILWLGIGELQKMFVLIIACVTYLTVVISDEVVKIPSQIIDTAYTLGADNYKIIKKNILPYFAPAIYDYCRLIFGVGWIVIIMVEMIGAEAGLGHMIIEAQRYLQTPKVIAGVLIIAIVGFCVDFILNKSYKLLFPWSQKGEASD